MYREITMLEVTKVLRLWLGGMPKKRIAAQLGFDPKTVRHYVAVVTGTGLQRGPLIRQIADGLAERRLRQDGAREVLPHRVDRPR